MSKTSRDNGPRDDNHIEPEQKLDRQRWSEKLGVNPDELKAAIDAVGSNPTDVERYLRDHAQSSRSA
jgi:hypothetical protein